MADAEKVPELTKRAALRYPVSVPAMLTEGALRVTGVVENLSSKGALVTHVSERPEVGTVGRLRLTNLRGSLRTSGADSLKITCQVVRHDPAGFAVVFLNGSDAVSELLDRAFARGFSSDSEDA